MTELMGVLNIIQLYFGLKNNIHFLYVVFVYKIKVVYLQKEYKY